MPTEHTIVGENAAIELYCKRNQATVLEKPNPPEAIIEYRIGKRKTWLEVRAAYMGEKHRKHQSYAAALNSDKSKFSQNSPAIFFTFNPPENSSDYWQSTLPSIIYAIEEKDKNQEYITYVKKYGKGILLLNWESLPPEIGNFPEKMEMPIDCDQFQEIFLHLPQIHQCHAGSMKSFNPQLIPIILIPNKT
jgi:hypothetical protein